MRREVGPLLEDASCVLAESIELKPWKDFRVEQYQDSQGRTRYRCPNGKQTPEWWRAYNKVKHQRAALNPSTPEENYGLANFGNVVQAFAGLYMLEYALLCELGTENDLEGFLDDSVLFRGRDKIVTSSDVDRFFAATSVR